GPCSNDRPGPTGADGVHGVLEILRTELDRVMAFCGQTDVEELEPNLVSAPVGWGPGRMYP
ncbi:MAG: alpha-hydroxy-acid oxidizing protein, partial [Dehalococcoidia bacterium]